MMQARPPVTGAAAYARVAPGNALAGTALLDSPVALGVPVRFVLVGAVGEGAGERSS